MSIEHVLHSSRGVLPHADLNDCGAGRGRLGREGNTYLLREGSYISLTAAGMNVVATACEQSNWHPAPNYTNEHDHCAHALPPSCAKKTYVSFPASPATTTHPCPGCTSVVALHPSHAYVSTAAAPAGMPLTLKVCPPARDDQAARACQTAIKRAGTGAPGAQSGCAGEAEREAAAALAEGVSSKTPVTRGSALRQAHPYCDPLAPSKASVMAHAQPRAVGR